MYRTWVKQVEHGATPSTLTPKRPDHRRRPPQPFEFKVNPIRPAAGERFRATGTVKQAWRCLVICRAEAEAWDGGAWKRIALMQATMMCLRDRAGLVD